MEANVTWLAIVGIFVLAFDALACIGPIPYIRKDLERLGCTENIIRAIPVVKFLAVAGLIVGLWVPWIGVAAAVGMLVYFGFAFAYHQRANDSFDAYIPAVLFTAFFAVVLFVSYATAL